MLCEACREVFSSPSKLAYGSIRPWRQTGESFRAALAAGCRLCHLIDEARRYNDRRDAAFPERINYAFKPLKSDWARHGKGLKWFIYQDRSGDDFGELDRYLSAVEKDPTPNRLGALLAADADNAAEEAAKTWIVLQFYGCEDIILPVEICTDHPLERIAHTNVDEQTSTGHPDTLALAKAWLQNCLQNHPTCGPRHPEDWLPSRLLDVGTPETPLLRLVSGDSLDAKSQYVALSHRWGANKTLTLRSESVSRYQTAIPTSHISATVRDAVEATRALGIRYLWVDCMCIIQDDDGHDWARESDTMFKVYGLATCTIAAANSGDGNGGIFADRNQYRVRPLRVNNPFSLGRKYKFNIMSQYLNRIYEDGVRSSEWFSRGWVFQERMMSPRLLVFSRSQILWGCPQLQAAETWPCGKTGENFIDRFTSVEVEKMRLHALTDKSVGIARSHSSWWTFLSDYMASELTVSSDRLAAIRGIASMVEDLTGERYCGGFWLTKDLPNALLWSVAVDVYHVPRPPEYRAPSFSWGVIEHRHQIQLREDLKGVTNLVRALEGVTLEVNSRGRNIREALRVSGRLLPGSILTASTDQGSHSVMTRAAGLVLRPIIEQEKKESEIRRERMIREDKIRREKEMAYAKTIPGRFHAFASKVTNKVSEMYSRADPRVLDTCGMGMLVLLGTILAPVAVAVLLAAVGIALALAAVAAGAVIALAPVAGVLYLFFLLLVGINNMATRYYWDKLYPKFYAEEIRLAEEQRAREKIEHEEDMVRRQRQAEERAERVFADLEKGLLPDEPSDWGRTRPDGAATDDGPGEKEGGGVVFSFYSDFRLPRWEVIDVFCLPLISTSSGVRGLVVKLVDGTDDHYERLGVFGPSAEGITRLPEGEEQVFLLV